ncbi:uncharacterized protein LOC130648984 [Hydractinia symbiolongicarpus]|uniref:uncharacterized protein LOC130648984 n=1 Tax=Hydractinia symbiolongicarpus TaxID=13093 RepID=UPI00254EBDDC|nr:uncharacterized protein LOC130648984 [Hydractinia symbiolongicarpus]
MKTQEATENFVEIWRSQPSLWDVKSLFHKDRNEKAKSYEIFKGRLGIEEKIVRSKINTLRSYFSAELKKVNNSNKSGAGRDDVYESKWPYFQSLLFLRDSIVPRKTTSSLEFDYNENTADKESGSLQNSPITLQEWDMEDEIDVCTTDVTSTKKPLPKKQKVSPKSSEDHMLKHAISVLEEKRGKTLSADELYGRTLGESLKAIPDRMQKEYLKVKIQELLFQAQMGLLAVPSFRTPTVQSPIPRNSSTHATQSYPPFVSPPLSPVLQNMYRHPVKIYQNTFQSRESLSDLNRESEGLQSAGY